jgi:ribosome-associated heat shock protein Hsp15
MKGLRLDKFLWFARLTKTRSLAQRAIADGHIRLEGARILNCHAVVLPGQTLTLTLNDRLHVIRIEALPERRGPAPEARSCYLELVAPQKIDDAADRL